MGLELQMYLDPVKRTFMFDHSTMAIGCNRKVYWSRFRSLKKIVEGEATYFGKSIHKFVELFWLGKEYDDCINAYYDLARAEDSPLLDDPDVKGERTVQRGFEICTFYYNRYRNSRLVIHPYILNGKPLVEVPFAFPLGIDEDGWTIIYCGRIDRVEVRDGRFVWIIDTKTTTRFGERYWQILRPNDAITGYAAGLRELTGIIPNFYAIDVIAFGTPRERVPKDIKDQGPVAEAEYKANVRFEQGPTSRSAEDISDWWDNTLREGIRLRKMWTEFKDDHKNWTRRTSLCGEYGGCAFRDICKVPVGFEPIANSLYVYKVWTPFDEEGGKEPTE